MTATPAPRLTAVCEPCGVSLDVPHTDLGAGIIATFEHQHAGHGTGGEAA